MKRGLVFLVWAYAAACLFACSSDDEEPNDPNALTPHEQEVVSYFTEVALGGEFDNEPPVTRKWLREMKVYVGGTPDLVLRSELDDVISEINDLVHDGFQITTTTDSASSNAYIFFGAPDVFEAWYPPAAQYIDDNWGLFFSFPDNSTNELYRAVMFVDMVRNADKKAQRHILREELTQSLGLARDAGRYDDSIFQQAWTTVTEYAPIDRELIWLLYDPAIAPGLDSATVTPLLQQLLKEKV
jgi:hypothetical protein